MAARVLFHVQHLLGIGHVKRAAAIARAAAGAGLEVTVASGGHPVAGVDFGAARVVQLPPASAADDTFSVLLDENGRPIDDAWRQRRREGLLALFDEVRPQVLLFELFPFGRRQFRFEILPLLDAAARASPRPVVACSVRDILVAKPKPKRNQEVADTVRDYFDAVLVHGDRALITLDETFPLTGQIADRIRYTGYVADSTAPLPGPRQESGEILVSAGGGSVGEPLLRAALAARPLSAAADRPWRLVTGLNLPMPVVEDIRRLAPDGVTIEHHRTDFRRVLAASALSISQAGYNTVMDILTAGVRAVVVPFAGGSESEQNIRADLLARKGWLTRVDPKDLSAQSLAAAVDTALARPTPKIGHIDLNGAARSAEELRILAQGVHRK